MGGGWATYDGTATIVASNIAIRLNERCFADPDMFPLTQRIEMNLPSLNSLFISVEPFMFPCRRRSVFPCWRAVLGSSRKRSDSKHQQNSADPQLQVRG